MPRPDRWPPGRARGDQFVLVPRGDRDEPVAAAVDPGRRIRGVDVPVPRAVLSRQPAYGHVQSSVRIIASDWERSIICPSRSSGARRGPRGSRWRTSTPRCSPRPRTPPSSAAGPESRDGGEPRQPGRWRRTTPSPPRTAPIARTPSWRRRRSGVPLPKLQVPDPPRVHRAGTEISPRRHRIVPRAAGRAPSPRPGAGRALREACSGSGRGRPATPPSRRTPRGHVPHQVAAGRHLDLDHLGAEEAE